MNTQKSFIIGPGVLFLFGSCAGRGAEGAFREKLVEAITANLVDPELDVEKLARIMLISRSVLYRKIKHAYNLTPKKLINVIRLLRAAYLLEEGTWRIYEIADRVGFSSHTVFGRNFQKQFGTTPLSYLGMLKEGKNSLWPPAVLAASAVALPANRCLYWLNL